MIVMVSVVLQRDSLNYDRNTLNPNLPKEILQSLETGGEQEPIGSMIHVWNI